MSRRWTVHSTIHVKLKNALRADFLQKSQIPLEGRWEGGRRVWGRARDVFLLYFPCTSAYRPVCQRPDKLTLRSNFVLETPYKGKFDVYRGAGRGGSMGGRPPGLIFNPKPPGGHPEPFGARSQRPKWSNMGPPPHLPRQMGGGSPIFRFIM